MRIWSGLGGGRSVCVWRVVCGGNGEACLEAFECTG